MLIMEGGNLISRFPLPKGLTGSPSLPKTQTSLLNCFNNGEEPPVVLQRPGIRLLNTTGDLARGHFNWRDRLFQVVSERLIRIDDPITGAFTEIGTIAGSEPIDFSIGFNFAVIVVKGPSGKGYTLSVADALVEITDPQFVASVSVANIKGITVYIPFDGDPAFFGNPGDPGTIELTSFFDAEQLPDRNNAVFNLSDTLYIMGTDSIEPFRVVTSSILPFRSVTGGRINNGFIGGLLEYGDTFLFIGNEKDQGFGIYAIGQGRAPKISNERIDDILSTYTQEELSEAIPGTVKVGGHFLATFQLRRDSFGFYKGEWFLLETVFDGISRPWGGGFIAHLNGNYFTAFEDKIGVFDEDINTDYGERVTRSIKMIFIQEDGNWFPCTRMELGISQGFNKNIDKSSSLTKPINVPIDSVTNSILGSFSGNSFFVGTQELVPTGVTFNNDGTKMFIVGTISDSVFEYSLSVGFDLTTALFSGNSFSVGAQDGFPQGIAFNNDGTKMFMVGNSTDKVYEYSLSTGFDLGSIVAFTGNSFSVAGQDTAPTGIAFNNDGTKMFMVGVINDSVNEYSLSTAFDITSASFTSSFSVTGQDTFPTGIAFNNDGTRLFMVGSSTNKVYEYSLSTAFDLTSTVVFTGLSFSVAGQDTDSQSIAFNNDGTKMFMVGFDTENVFEYNLSFGIAQFNFPATPGLSMVVGQQVTIEGFFIKPSYNLIGLVAGTDGATNFQIASLAFVGDEPNIGRFTTPSFVEILETINRNVGGSVALLTSRDGVLFGPPVYRDLGKLGDYQSRLIWRGIGRFQSFMAVEFRTTQDIKFAVAYVEAAIG